jgi:metal-responsive CopG/Arc/MetJ family transcriptional regulator
MSKSRIGKPGIRGQGVLVKIPSELLAELDEVWPKVGSGSRNDYIRRALWEEVHRTKAKLAEGSN